MPIEQVEFNTIITFLGMFCATVQGVTGYYAAYYRKRAAWLKTNDVLARAHRAFGSFATVLYLLGVAVPPRRHHRRADPETGCQARKG
jgi:hypothetical protein